MLAWAWECVDQAQSVMSDQSSTGIGAGDGWEANRQTVTDSHRSESRTPMGQISNCDKRVTHPSSLTMFRKLATRLGDFPVSSCIRVLTTSARSRSRFRVFYFRNM